MRLTYAQTKACGVNHSHCRLSSARARGPSPTRLPGRAAPGCWYSRYAANISNRLASNGLRPPLVSARSHDCGARRGKRRQGCPSIPAPQSSGRGVPAAAFRTGGWDPLLGVLDRARDPGPAARGTSGPENQEPVAVAVPEATSDPGTPGQEQDLAGTALVRVAAEWSWCSPSAPGLLR
jgi:hypothetical protein